MTEIIDVNFLFYLGVAVILAVGALWFWIFLKLRKETRRWRATAEKLSMFVEESEARKWR
jgi:ABC-type nickel/cobalt efflux system permease component RcnA